MPRSEPEMIRKKGRLHVAWCNERARKPYAKGIYIALELAEQAYEAHGLPYEPEEQCTIGDRRYRCLSEREPRQSHGRSHGGERRTRAQPHHGHRLIW
jgi:hypothetical protein